MKKYKDSFETRSESLIEGGEGILTAVTNKDPDAVAVRAKAPELSKPKNSSSISPIRTLADDLEHTVISDNVSLAGQVLENKTRTKEEAEIRSSELSQNTLKHKRERTTMGGVKLSKTLIFLLFAFVIFGGSLSFFLSRQDVSLKGFTFSLSSFNLTGFSSEKEPLMEGGPQFPESLVQVDDSRALYLGQITNKTTLKEALEAESLNARVGELIALAPAETVATETGEESIRFVDSARFFKALDIPLLSTLSRNLSAYTFGVLGGGDEGQAFLVARVRSYEEVYGTFLQKEDEMAKEFYGVFHSSLDLAIASSSPAFSDSVVLGNDARVLVQEIETTAPDGEISTEARDMLAYMFIDKETLIIAGTREDLENLASRFR